MKKALLLLAFLASLPLHASQALTVDVAGPGAGNILNTNVSLQFNQMNFMGVGSINGNTITTGTGTLTLGSVALNAGTGGTLQSLAFLTPGTGVATVLSVPSNTANGLVASDAYNVVKHPTAFPVGSYQSSFFCIGDSTTLGVGVSGHPRQTYPSLLSTLGAGVNSSTVTNFGFSGYTTYSASNIYSTNQSVTQWTGGIYAPATVSTCPHTALPVYDVIYLGTNDYFGIFLSGTLSTSSKTVTVSTTTYLTDPAGHARVIAPGDMVTVYSGAGTLPVNTTVASVVLNTSITLNNFPTTNGSVLLEVVPTPTSSTFAADLTGLIAKCKADGAKVLVCTLPPANNTATPSNGTISQGNFQANRLVYNAYIRSLTFDGVGSDPDKLVDLAADPSFTSFNAQLYAADQLHPAKPGNDIITNDVNAALLSFMLPSQWFYQLGSECVPDTSLSENIPLLNAPASAANNFQNTQFFHANNGSDFAAIQGSLLRLQGVPAGGANASEIFQFAFSSIPNEINFTRQANCVQTTGTTNGTTTVTITGTTTGLTGTMHVYGADIPVGTTATFSGTTATLSAAANGSGITNETLYFISYYDAQIISNFNAFGLFGPPPTSGSNNIQLTPTAAAGTGGVFTYNGNTLSHVSGGYGFQSMAGSGSVQQFIVECGGATSGSRNFGIVIPVSGEIDFGSFADTPVYNSYLKQAYITGGSNTTAGLWNFPGGMASATLTASTMLKANSGKQVVSAVAGTDYSLITVQTGTLVGGTATKTVPSGCHPWVQDNATSLTNVGSLVVTVSGTTATVTSTNPLDTSPFTLFNAGSQ